MKTHWKYKFHIIMGLALMGLAASDVQAQSRSGNGGINATNLVESNCVSDVRRLEVLVEELETFARELEACNDSGQVFDGVNCANIAQLDAVWDNAAAPTLLQLQDNGTVIQSITVNRGTPGADGVCPNQPTTPPPPPPPTPNDCRAPWGAVVAHGSDVEAFETASVPNGQTCNSEMRLCTDGRLAGSFTNQNCAVEPPPPPPEDPPAPDYVWRSTGMYSTQQAIPESVMDGPCGDQEWVHCRGCATFPFTSNCSQGAACDPNAQYQVCLINERQCGFAIAWDRYECMPNFGLPPL